MAVITPALGYFDRIKLRHEWVRYAGIHQYDICATLTYSYRCYDPVKAEKRFVDWLLNWQAQAADERGLLTEYPCDRMGRFRYAVASHRWCGKWWNSYKSGRAKPVYVIAIEHRWSGEVHVHALIKWSPVLKDLDPRRGQRIWQGSLNEGGFAFGDARVERVKDKYAARVYLAKNNIHGEVDIIPSQNFC